MQEFYYRRVEDGTFCLTGYEGDEAEVIIPDDKVFTILSDKVFLTGYEGDEAEVIIPDDKVFTILSDKVFRGHDEITSVQIPDSVTDMGEFLFDGCINLRQLKLPE